MEGQGGDCCGVPSEIEEDMGAHCGSGKSSGMDSKGFWDQLDVKSREIQYCFELYQ